MIIRSYELLMSYYQNMDTYSNNIGFMCICNWTIVFLCYLADYSMSSNMNVHIRTNMLVYVIKTDRHAWANDRLDRTGIITPLVALLHSTDAWGWCNRHGNVWEHKVTASVRCSVWNEWSIKAHSHFAALCFGHFRHACSTWNVYIWKAFTLKNTIQYNIKITLPENRINAWTIISQTVSFWVLYHNHQRFSTYIAFGTPYWFWRSVFILFPHSTAARTVGYAPRIRPICQQWSDLPVEWSLTRRVTSA